MIARLLIAFLAVPCVAYADDAGVTPVGWVKSSDGSFTHTERGFVCKAAINAYTLQRVDGPADPNILGTCVYSGGVDRIGLIRVRKFIDGVGDTPLAVQNDRRLMGLAPANGVPAGAKLVEAYRS